MNESVGLLIAYLASLAKVQAEKLVAAQIQLFRLKSMTVPVEPTTGHCPSCAALRARLLIVEHIHAFLLRLLKRAEVPCLAPDKAWICAFVERNAIPKKMVKRLFGISTASYYRWRMKSLGFGVSAFRHLAKMLPDTITFWVYAVKAANPTWGKLRISQAMVSLGLPISPSSVWRYLRRVRPMPKKPSFKRPDPDGSGIPAAYPNHYWAADTTTISCFGFFRVRILAVIDLYSRNVLALRAFVRVTPADVRLAMNDLFVRFGRPKHFLSDHGGEFSHLDLGVDHRFGRVGCPASTARVERFFRSLKWEALKYLFCPTPNSCQRYLDQYREFFNRWRPHQALGGLSARQAGRTPEDVYSDREVESKPTRENFAPLPRENAEHLSFCDGLITAFHRKAA